MSEPLPMRGITEEHTRKAKAIVDEAHAADGLAPLDLERFWEDQEAAAADPWSKESPQLPVGGLATGECVFAELGIGEEWEKYYHDREWRAARFVEYNDKAEGIIGRRPLPEGPPPDPTRAWPGTKGLNDVFEAKNVWHDNSWWLQQAADSEDELAALLDRVEARLENLRDFMLPDNWEEEKQRLTDLGVPGPRYRGQRGPVTFAMSVYGVENLIFLINDNPDLARRFSDCILRSMLGIAGVLDAEAGDPDGAQRPGFAFCDDNCCLLTPDMYELFAYPVLEGVFDRFCPKPEHWRFQHSDSAMGHLLPLLGRLGLKGCNFGPTVLADEIRAHLPKAVISGVLAPFTYSRNDEVRMIEELLRDFDMQREQRGLVFSTAGSVNNGSRLTGMRLVMAAVQRYCRYD